MSEKDFEPLKPLPRQLSKFLAEEMLYDAISQNLDPSREAALQEFLQTSPETVAIQNQMSSARDYCAQLSETQVSEPFLARLSQMKSPYQRVVDTLAWSKWPDTLRWTIEALVVAGLASIVVIFLWPYISQYAPTRSQEVVLVEVDKPQVSASEPKEEEAAVVANESEAPAISISANTELKEPVVKSELPKAPVAPETAPVEPPPPPPKPEPVPPPVTVVAEEKPAPRESGQKPARKGELYRAVMTLDNIDIVTEQITTMLVGFGAEKAGDVKLGWRKPSGSYYHFSLPDQNYDAVLAQLQSFGPVRISKEPHWRVMPEGKIRFILDVKDAAATEANQE